MSVNNDFAKKAKITFVLGGLAGGGAERVASHLINYWHNKGFKIVLISRRGSDNDFYQIPAEIERYNLGGEGESSNKLTALKKNIAYVRHLRKTLKKTDTRNVISFLTKTNIHVLLASTGLKKNLIISERSDTTKQKHPLPWPLLRKWLYKFADKVTANSMIAIEGMREFVPEEKLQLVSNPVYVPEDKAKPDQAAILLNVGRLVPEKAQALILKAFSLIDRELIKNWSCEILGKGEEMKNLLCLVQQLEISDQVILHGLVKNPHDYYLSAGIFVLSSEYEGTPNALLEAMAHGLPCIVSDSLPGALKLISDGKNGLIFSSGDIRDLSVKITMLMENPVLRAQLGDRARQTVKKYSPEKVFPEWEKLLVT